MGVRCRTLYLNHGIGIEVEAEVVVQFVVQSAIEAAVAVAVAPGEESKTHRTLGPSTPEYAPSNSTASS